MIRFFRLVLASPLLAIGSILLILSIFIMGEKRWGEFERAIKKLDRQRERE